MEFICPKCKSDNLEYMASDDYGTDGRTESFTCKDCGCVAHEHYTLTYVETIIDEQWEKNNENDR